MRTNTRIHTGIDTYTLFYFVLCLNDQIELDCFFFFYIMKDAGIMIIPPPGLCVHMLVSFVAV